jgi:hypothetical protein
VQEEMWVQLRLTGVLLLLPGGHNGNFEVDVKFRGMVEGTGTPSQWETESPNPPQDRTFFGIATARHVVSYADEWQQPIRLQHYPSSSIAFLKEGERIIFPDADTDSAVILVHSRQLQLPETPIPLLPNSVALAIGTEVGWLGFPTLAASTLCFFSGMVSARQE